MTKRMGLNNYYIVCWHSPVGTGDISLSNLSLQNHHRTWFLLYSDRNIYQNICPRSVPLPRHKYLLGKEGNPLSTWLSVMFYRFLWDTEQCNSHLSNKSSSHTGPGDIQCNLPIEALRVFVKQHSRIHDKYQVDMLGLANDHFLSLNLYLCRTNHKKDVENEVFY